MWQQTNMWRINRNVTVCEMWHLTADEHGLGNSHGRESCMDLLIVDGTKMLLAKLTNVIFFAICSNMYDLIFCVDLSFCGSVSTFLCFCVSHQLEIRICATWILAGRHRSLLWTQRIPVRYSRSPRIPSFHCDLQISISYFMCPQNTLSIHATARY